VKFTLAALAATTGVANVFTVIIPPHEKLSVAFLAGAYMWRHSCWKFTVVTLYAQLTSDLLAIAKFLIIHSAEQCHQLGSQYRFYLQRY